MHFRSNEKIILRWFYNNFVTIKTLDFFERNRWCFLNSFKFQACCLLASCCSLNTFLNLKYTHKYFENTEWPLITGHSFFKYLSTTNINILLCTAYEIMGEVYLLTFRRKKLGTLFEHLDFFFWTLSLILVFDRELFLIFC